MGGLRPHPQRDTQIYSLYKKYLKVQAQHPQSAFGIIQTKSTAIASGIYTRSILEERIALMEHAYPSSPTRTPKYGFYVIFNNNFMFQNFVGKYAAKDFVDRMIRKQKIKWVSDKILETEDGLTIRAEHYFDLDEIVEYEPTMEELGWSPDRIKLAIYAGFLSGEHTAQSISTIPTRHKKASRAGLVTIQDIAQELDLDPKEARKRLRTRNIPKPQVGWAWSNEDAEKIKDKIRAR